jgi:hypothetical protein
MNPTEGVSVVLVDESLGGDLTRVVRLEKSLKAPHLV